MIVLDTRTLFLLAMIITFFVGGMVLLAALRGRRSRTLLWTSAAGMLSGVAYLIALWTGPAYWGAASVRLSNMALLTAMGCLWASLRCYTGKPVRWWWVVAGALVWAMLSLWPRFLNSIFLRTAVFSSLGVAYNLACMLELRARWPIERWQVLPVAVIFTWQCLFSAWRLLPRDLALPSRWVGGDFSLAVVEGLVFMVCVMFGIVLMVRDRSERRYRRAALHDELTALLNRRALFSRAPTLIDGARERHGEVAALMCDLDHFKALNDHHGHAAGDQLLAFFGNLLRDATRHGDLCARIGGEEFVVVTAVRTDADAVTLAERIRSRLEAVRGPHGIAFTVSIGVAATSVTGYDLERLLTRADRALYRAKQQRNTVALWNAADEATTAPSGAHPWRLRPA